MFVHLGRRHFRCLEDHECPAHDRKQHWNGSHHQYAFFFFSCWQRYSVAPIPSAVTSLDGTDASKTTHSYDCPKVSTHFHHTVDAQVARSPLE